MSFNLLLPVAMLFALASGYNYCNNKTHVCNQQGWQHFICRLDQELPSFGRTRFEEIVPNTKYFQKEVLGLLNNFRNTLASGNVTTASNQTYPSAARMRELIWDSELDYLARVHASTVSFKHTECRSTQRFPFVGEILAIMAASTTNKATVGNVLREAFKPMWKQHLAVQDPESFCREYDSVRDFRAGDFAIIINDRVSRVGCSIAVGSNCPHGDTTGFCHFLTCYFDNNNIANTSVYQPGVPTSSCDHWKTSGDVNYGNLCRNVGEIFPNDSDS